MRIKNGDNNVRLRGENGICSSNGKVDIGVLFENFLDVCETTVTNKILNSESRSEVVTLILGSMSSLTSSFKTPHEFKVLRGILLDAVNTKPLGIAILKVISLRYYTDLKGGTPSVFTEFGFDTFSAGYMSARRIAPILSSKMLGTILMGLDLNDVLKSLSDEQVEIIRDLYIPLYHSSVSNLSIPNYNHVSFDIVTLCTYHHISNEFTCKKKLATYLKNRLSLLSDKFKLPMFREIIETGEMEQILISKIEDVYEDFNISDVEIFDEINQKDIVSTTIEISKDVLRDFDGIKVKMDEVCNGLISIDGEFIEIGYVDQEKMTTYVTKYKLREALSRLSDKVDNAWVSFIIYNMIINLLVEIFITRSTIEDFKDLLLLNDMK